MMDYVKLWLWMMGMVGMMAGEVYVRPYVPGWTGGVLIVTITVVSLAWAFAWFGESGTLENVALEEREVTDGS